MIRTALNTMIYVMLAKFIINDLPHAAGLLANPNYGVPPTPGQLRYIAILCQQLKITTPYEEQVKTSGEAGRLIRELETERKHRKQLGQSSATSFRLERTTVDQVVDNLEHTWHRIESDVSIRMQSALGILKEVMGYYYEEPCVVAWGNNNLVGIAVYETGYDKDKGIQDTHIKELASFTHEPGVGKSLVGEVIRIGREENSDIVSASYAPGARGFYESLGFVQHGYYLGEPILMMYSLKSGNPELPEVVITEIEENITARIPGIRAVAELTRLSQSEAVSFGLEANNWLWFNRLINQSGIPRVGTLLLDGVLKYCKEKNYSIVNQVNAYGAISQKELEDWYIRKEFTPVDYKKYGNALLNWVPRSGNPTVRVDTNEEVSQTRVSGVAIAWVGSKDVGSLHYDLEINGTGEILFMQVDEEYRSLGVGKKMYQAVENLARGHGVGKFTSEVGIPGYGDVERAKRFWESVGFTVTNDYAEKQLKNSSPNTAVGTCYSDAWRFLIKQGEGHLVHGSVQLSAEGPRVNHAWVELTTGWVWEPQTGQYFTIEDFRVLSPTEEHRYTVEEAAIMAARTGNHGPWTAEERNMWL